MTEKKIRKPFTDGVLFGAGTVVGRYLMESAVYFGPMVATGVAKGTSFMDPTLIAPMVIVGLGIYRHLGGDDPGAQPIPRPA